MLRRVTLTTQVNRHTGPDEPEQPPTKLQSAPESEASQGRRKKRESRKLQEQKELGRSEEPYFGEVFRSLETMMRYPRYQ